jgi:hypothetical protein
MGLHLPQMTGMAAIRSCFGAATLDVGRALTLERCGLERGCNAGFGVLQARDPAACRAAEWSCARQGYRTEPGPDRLESGWDRPESGSDRLESGPDRPAPLPDVPRAPASPTEGGLRTYRERYGCLPMFIHRT